MLREGNLNFIIDAAGDIQDLIKNGYDMTNIERKTLFKLKLYVVFKNDQVGKELSLIFDKRIGKMKKSGELKKLYDYYIKNNLIRNN